MRRTLIVRGAIIRMRLRAAPTTTVPDVIGLTEQQASAAIVAAGLTASPQINLKSPPDTVTAQNAPAGTVEPMGSPVQITVGVRPRNP